MVGIKDFEMPSNCYMCDLHNYHYCDLTGESIEEDYCWNGNSREKHCPLREVEAIPKDQLKELRSMALRVKHNTGSIDTLIDKLDDLLSEVKE
jgi:hypothetical protein